tara:strand:+ start:6981 stop:7793 length:813 start_codon:yes stop_codon:yes gene_type:complete
MSIQQAQMIHQKQLQKWQMNGHEPVYERGSVRLANFKKSLPDDLEVTVLDPATNDYVPFILTCGRALKCGEVLPERADLALDEKGRLRSQAEFEQAYSVFLDAFVYVEGSDTGFEPVPNVVDFVRQTPDTFSESSGMIEIGFDPKLDEEFKPQRRYGPDGQSEEEYQQEQANNTDIAAALKSIAETQALLAAQLNQVQSAPAPVSAPREQAAAASTGMNAEKAKAATADNDSAEAPCGKKVRKGYVKQHQRFCDADECGGESENAEKGKT